MVEGVSQSRQLAVGGDGAANSFKREAASDEERVRVAGVESRLRLVVGDRLVMMDAGGGE